MGEQCNICLYLGCRADCPNRFFSIHSLDTFFVRAHCVPGAVLSREDTIENQIDKNSYPHRGCVQVEEDRQPYDKKTVSNLKYNGEKSGKGGTMKTEDRVSLGIILDLEA